MDTEEKWYFSKEQLANTPSRKCGYDVDRELSCRQQAANFIQDMGQRLQVTQLCINTAIVYMHRFYVFHSFTQFHRNAMAAAALFLAAKVEEQPRKLEHVIKVAQMCLHRELPPLDTKSEAYLEQAQDLVMNENVLLQTLGFDVAIDHPHTHVVRCCHLVKASKDLAQTSYFMASNSLHLTTMCLQYKPTVVACFCIHLACKWSNWEIPLSNESKSWFWYVDRSVTQELLEQLTDEFLRIFEKCPSRLKRKITTYQNMSGYLMGSSELSTKRLPGGDLQHGVSFQQPVNRSRPLNEESRKRLEGFLPPSNLPPSNRPPVPVPDFKKQQLPPAPPIPGVHVSGGLPYGVTSYHMPSTSQASGSHQQMGAQFMYPMSTGMSSVSGNSMSTQMSMPHMSNPMLNIRVPPPPPPPQAASAQKHSIRPEAMFPPPKRSSSHSSTRSHSVKTETLNSTPQPPKAHSQSHHGSRNGTEHNMIVTQSQMKTEMKYPVEKHSSHHKGHSKYESSRSQSSSVNWGGSGDGVGRSSVDPKLPKSDMYTLSMPMAGNIKQESAPPLPPPPLPALPPPPPPVVPPPPPSTKPSSIFSPHKMTPPLPSTPPRDIKPNILSPMLLSPLTPNKSGRNRTSSSSSEPELIPVMPKLEDISGFESLARGKTAIKLPKVPDTLQHPKEKRKESLTTNIVKEVKQEPIQPVHKTREVEIIEKPFESEPIEIVDSPVTTKREHKKKKKHKEHREHKEHKDKEKDKEKKKDKHKEKHRDKEREKEKIREDPAPIKITIPKDKIGKMIPPPAPIKAEQSASLKIKIPKDKLVAPQVEQQNWFSSSSSLKIKISKDALLSVSSAPPPSSKSSSSSSSKKRERSSHRNEDGKYSHTSKHAKLSKSNGDYRSSEGDYYE